MLRFEVAVLIYSTVIVSPCVAQDNVSKKTDTYLQAEWMDTAHGSNSGIVLCLAALDNYTGHGSPDQ